MAIPPELCSTNAVNTVISTIELQKGFRKFPGKSSSSHSSYHMTTASSWLLIRASLLFYQGLSQFYSNMASLPPDGTQHSSSCYKRNHKILHHHTQSDAAPRGWHELCILLAMGWMASVSCSLTQCTHIPHFCRRIGSRVHSALWLNLFLMITSGTLASMLLFPAMAPRLALIRLFLSLVSWPLNVLVCHQLLQPVCGP